jgi:hypothetical protein
MRDRERNGKCPKKEKISKEFMMRALRQRKGQKRIYIFRQAIIRWNFVCYPLDDYPSRKWMKEREREIHSLFWKFNPIEATTTTLYSRKKALSSVSNIDHAWQTHL